MKLEQPGLKRSDGSPKPETTEVDGNPVGECLRPGKNYTHARTHVRTTRIHNASGHIYRMSGVIETSR